MQDGDAHVSVQVHVRVPEGGLERELGRGIGVLGRESHLGLEVAARVRSVRGPKYDHVPVQDVLLVGLSGEEHRHSMDSIQSFNVSKQWN